MDRCKKVEERLKEIYKEPRAELEFKNNFELLVAVVLSAQCTDKRVNSVTKVLFSVAPTPKDMASLSLKEIEDIIKPCGFFHAKAKSLKSLSEDIVEKFGGTIPETKEKLKTLRGVGEKTANVVIANAFSVPAIAVDTHVFRVSNRLGIAKSQSVLGVQKQLESNFPREFWIDLHHSLVLHGRYVCKARKPDCENCSLKQFCKFYDEEVISKNSVRVD